MFNKAQKHCALHMFKIVILDVCPLVTDNDLPSNSHWLFMCCYIKHPKFICIYSQLLFGFCIDIRKIMYNFPKEHLLDGFYSIHRGCVVR